MVDDGSGFLSRYLETIKDLPNSTRDSLKKIRELDVESTQLEQECFQAERAIAATVQSQIQSQIQAQQRASLQDREQEYRQDLEEYRAKRRRLASIDNEKVATCEIFPTLPTCKIAKLLAAHTITPFRCLCVIFMCVRLPPSTLDHCLTHSPNTLRHALSGWASG